MTKKWLLISLSGLILLILIAACAQTTPIPMATDEAEALVTEKCSDCHSTDRVFNADYDEAGWSDVFDRMIDKGAEVTEQEKEVMIDWLVSQDQ